MGGWMNRWIGGWVNGWVSRWIGRWMDRQMNGQKDRRQKIEALHKHTHLCIYMETLIWIEPLINKHKVNCYLLQCMEVGWKSPNFLGPPIQFRCLMTLRIRRHQVYRPRYYVSVPRERECASLISLNMFWVSLREPKLVLSIDCSQRQVFLTVKLITFKCHPVSWYLREIGNAHQSAHVSLSSNLIELFSMTSPHS